MQLAQLILESRIEPGICFLTFDFTQVMALFVLAVSLLADREVVAARWHLLCRTLAILERASQNKAAQCKSRTTTAARRAAQTSIVSASNKDSRQLYFRARCPTHSL
jgi:hypothetical protein